MDWRIVVVEDNRADFRWLQITLEELGLEPHLERYDDTLDALDAFKNHEAPDLIIADYFSPVLDFREFMAAVRKTPGYERTPVAVFSGVPVHNEVGDDVLCCLVKPVSALQMQHVFDVVAGKSVKNAQASGYSTGILP